MNPAFGYAVLGSYRWFGGRTTMRRFLYCLNVFGLLVGTSFALPSIGSAQPVIQPCGASFSPFPINQPLISESTTFQIAPEGLPGGPPGDYACIITGHFNLTTPLHFDFLDDSGSISDNLTITPIAGGVTVDLVSETDGGVPLTGTGDPNPQGEAPCSNADPTLGGLENCDYRIQRIPFSLQTGIPDITVISDTPSSFGGAAEVPEPSSGLLLGAILPALVGMWRFSKGCPRDDDVQDPPIRPLY